MSSSWVEAVLWELRGVEVTVCRGSEEGAEVPHYRVLFEINDLEKAWVVTGRHLGSVGSGRENRG